MIRSARNAHGDFIPTLSTPKGILTAYLVNQIVDFARDWSSARMSMPDFHVQRRRKLLQCQAITVSGLTIRVAARESVRTSCSQTHRNRPNTVTFRFFTGAAPDGLHHEYSLRKVAA